jgi:hypothetical protein
MSVILLSLCLWLVIGCGKSEDPASPVIPTSVTNPMVGLWKLELPDESKGKDASGTVTFTEDKFTIEFREGSRTESIAGSYTRSGKMVTLTPEMEGGKPSDDRPEIIILADDMKSFVIPNVKGKMVKQ